MLIKGNQVGWVAPGHHHQIPQGQVTHKREVKAPIQNSTNKRVYFKVIREKKSIQERLELLIHDEVFAIKMDQLLEIESAFLTHLIHR